MSWRGRAVVAGPAGAASGLGARQRPRIVPGSAAAYHLDDSPHVVSFVKNQGLGFAIPYLHAAGDHDSGGTGCA